MQFEYMLHMNIYGNFFVRNALCALSALANSKYEIVVMRFQDFSSMNKRGF